MNNIVILFNNLIMKNSPDQTLIAELSDNEGLIDKYFTKIRSNLDKLKGLDPSDQKRVKTQINNDLKSTNAVIETMKLEIQSLKEEANEKKYKEKISDLKIKYTNFNNEYKQAFETKSGQNVIDQTFNKLTGQESSLDVMNRGDAVLDESDKSIQRMEKKVTDSKEISKNIKSDLKKQMEQLDNTNKNLNEIDYSLGRAAKTLGNMAKMIASDKFIMAMILVIVLLIIGVIVYGAFFASPNDEVFNKFNDIFGKKSTHKTPTKI